MRRLLLLGAALAIPASGLSLALANGTAFAGGGPNGKTTCSTITGTASGTITISGCVDGGSASTGGGSQPVATSSLATGGTVTWLSSHTTTFSAATLTATSAKKCPGYNKANGSNNPTADKFSGTITADNAGFKLPGSYSGAVCISNDSNHDITALKPLKVK